MKVKYAAAAGGLLVVGAAILLAASFPRGLNGTWLVDYAVRDGVLKTQEYFDGDRFTFEGDRLTVVSKDLDGEDRAPKVSRLIIDAKAKTMDILHGDTRALAIYKLEGGRLTLCVQERDGPRPTRFESAKGSNVSLVVLKRK